MASRRPLFRLQKVVCIEIYEKMAPILTTFINILPPGVLVLVISFKRIQYAILKCSHLEWKYDDFLHHPEKTIEWVLPYHQYQSQLVDQAALMLTLSGRVAETKQVLANQTTFRLRTPDITITVRVHVFLFFFLLMNYHSEHYFSTNA